MLWRYEAQNLLAIRELMNSNLDSIYSSMVADTVWPSSGYLEAVCNRTMAEILGDYFLFRDNHKNVIQKNCTCGIYGFLDYPSRTLTRMTEYGKSIIRAVVIETSGIVFIGESGVIRAEAAQIVGVVGGICREREIAASEYFNVPIIELDQAQEMINKQMKVWDIAL